MKKQKTITMNTAVKKFFQGYVDFKGRATRAEYWWVVLAYIIAVLGASVIGGILGALIPALARLWLMLCGLAGLVCIIPAIALFVRRIHDCGFSAWVYFGPLLAIILLNMLGGIIGSAMIFALTGLIGSVLGIWGLVLALLPSKK